MTGLFRTTVVEISGVRTIAGGGTNASNAGQALANLGGVSIAGDQTVAGQKTFSNPSTIFGAGNFGEIQISDDAFGGELGILTTNDEVLAIKFNDGSFRYGGGNPGDEPLIISNGVASFQSIPLVSGKEAYFQKDIKSFTGNNFTPNANEARVFEYVLTGIAGATATLNAPTNMFNGDNILIEIQQSPSGSNSMVFGASYKFPGGVTPSLTLEANRVDIYTVLKIGSNFYSTYVKDFTS